MIFGPLEITLPLGVHRKCHYSPPPPPAAAGVPSALGKAFAGTPRGMVSPPGRRRVTRFLGRPVAVFGGV